MTRLARRRWLSRLGMGSRLAFGVALAGCRPAAGSEPVGSEAVGMLVLFEVAETAPSE